MSKKLCKHGWSLRFCEPCSTAAFMASVKGPGDGGMLAMQRELTALRAALSTARADALEEAARVVAAMPRAYDKVKEDVDVLGIGKGTWTLTLNNGPEECAAAIRALKEGK